MKKIYTQNPSCICCQNNIDFELPGHLLDDFLSGQVVIFAGSGISTESRNVLPVTFCEWIAGDLDIDMKVFSFSEVMEEYCKQPNGRIKLLNEIRSRFFNIRSFPELYYNATQFHRELATLPYIKTIITTNWDTYFEDECAAVPFIYPEDLAFWETNERRVLKIHGSIDNYGSIVATKIDYNKCLRKLRQGTLGGVLKTILATKTVVYIGYSFSDEDFQQIHKFVNNEMKGMSRQAYLVTLDTENIEKYHKLNLIPIITDGTYFINKIKEHAVSKEEKLPDLLYGYAKTMLKLFRIEQNVLHEEYNCSENPEIIYCAFYQDGAMHAYERILALRNTSRYSCDCEYLRTFKLYKEIRKEKVASKSYQDVAYIDGYLHAHLQLYSFLKEPDGTPELPRYYAYGYRGDLLTMSDYKKVFKKIPKFHKSAYNLAQKIVSRSNKGGTFVMHHPAYL